MSLTDRHEWKKLQAHQQSLANTQIRDLFSADRDRAKRFSLSAAGLYLDYAKNLCDDKALDLLIELANACDLPDHIDALFTGDRVNRTENSPALHTALRHLAKFPVYVDNKNVMSLIHDSWARMRAFTERVRQGQYLGFSGKRICDIVSIGVGGSSLGPLLLYRALQPYADPAIHCHFISNQDESACREILQTLNPETTLFIIVSKSFATQETLDNANRAKKWFLTAVDDEVKWQHHIVAVTEKTAVAEAYGVAKNNIFAIWSWVGGRFSLWSAVSLSVAIAIGWDHFQQFLAGAYVMDEHFRSADFHHNMPVLLALISIWYNNFSAIHTRAIIPYSQRLQYLPDYLKQLHMESQGKQIQQNGEPVNYHTGAVIWGGVGTDSQHSFHQLFLQGTSIVPIDFILVLKAYNSDACQLPLIANCLGQSETLMRGYDKEQICHDLAKQQLDSLLANHKMIVGNNPSNTIILEKLAPNSLGALLALYEHKVYNQSVIWNINAFDQWGVERGKQLASDILTSLQQGQCQASFDGSTRTLIEYVLNCNH